MRCVFIRKSFDFAFDASSSQLSARLTASSLANLIFIVAAAAFSQYVARVVILSKFS